MLAPMTAASEKMLLYTRTVAPKAPKKRSRAGKVTFLHIGKCIRLIGAVGKVVYIAKKR